MKLQLYGLCNNPIIQPIRDFRARQVPTSNLTLLFEQKYVYRSNLTIPGPFHCLSIHWK